MRIASFLALLVVATGLSAHEGHSEASFGHGVAHPFTGLDHLLAMVAVGLLAARHGGIWRWLLPVGFVAGLGLGGVLGAYTIGLPAVEMSIALSVLLLGVLLSFGTRIPAWSLALIVVAAAIPHGHAHLTEAGSGSVLGYGLGMVIGSAILHMGGLLAGLAIAKPLALRKHWQYAVGPGLACAGLALAVMVG